MAGAVELALQIRLGDLQIAKGHADLFVPHQFLESREAHPATEHVRGPGVAQAVRRDRAGVGTTGSLSEIGERDAQRLEQGKPAAYTRQQESFRFPEAGRGSLSAQLKNARQQPQPFRVEGNQAFSVKLAEGNVQSPVR